VKIVIKPKINVTIPPAVGLAVVIPLLIALLRWALGVP
jgi:hypothetical protein